MKVLIIEDEQPAALKLIRLLKEIDAEVEIMDVLSSVEHSINWLAEHPSPELIFMDIQLEDGISFEIFENCKIHTPVIFTTAYDAYALKAFKVNSVDYLLKPISPDDLKIAMDKYKSLHQPIMNYPHLQAIIKQLQPNIKERFLIKIGEHYISVQAQSINCFYIMERNTFVLTDKGKNYPIDYSLDKIEQLVDPKYFFRVNRNCIVNFSAIQDIISYSSSRLKIVLTCRTDLEDILVSRERVAGFKEWMESG